jgi:putative transcriptional regulator
MNRFSRDLLQGMKEACECAEGNASAARINVVEAPDVRAIRRRLHMSQHEFSIAFRIPLATIKNWEQGRRAPDAPAAAYLQAIARQPQVIREALATRAIAFERYGRRVMRPRSSGAGCDNASK